ncbi:calcium/proton exchanger [Tanacetum coccineum]
MFVEDYNLGSLVNFKWIAAQYGKEIIGDPFISYRKMKDDIRVKYLIDVSLGQCKRAKQRALHDHEGGLIEHYSRLYDYRKAILDSNPGSTCRLDVFESDGIPYFKRMYICFKGVKDDWLAGCRKVIGLDGCFLKHTCRGELLTAMGRDANNQMYPIAWVVVRVENAKNWSWFLALLQDDIALNDSTCITIISDSHKQIKLFDPLAYDYLVQRDPNTMDRRCAAFENGISESFNRAILSPRSKPIITMLEEIRLYIMQRLFAMNKIAVNLEDSITPSIRKRLKVLKEKQSTRIGLSYVVFPRSLTLEMENGSYVFNCSIRLVPRLTISGGTQDAGNGNAALQNLDEDVDGSKRRCIRQPDTTRPLEVVCFADSDRQRVQVPSNRNVNVPVQMSLGD